MASLRGSERSRNPVMDYIVENNLSILTEKSEEFGLTTRLVRNDSSPCGYCLFLHISINTGTKGMCAHTHAHTRALTHSHTLL